MVITDQKYQNKRQRRHKKIQRLEIVITNDFSEENGNEIEMMDIGGS